MPSAADNLQQSRAGNWTMAMNVACGLNAVGSRQPATIEGRKLDDGNERRDDLALFPDSGGFHARAGLAAQTLSLVKKLAGVCFTCSVSCPASSGEAGRRFAGAHWFVRPLHVQR